MPNAVIDPKTGLYVPRATFPELSPVTGSQQVAGISPFVQPVMIVNPYGIKQGQGETPEDISESLSAGPTTVITTNNDVVRWLVTTPFNRANNTGISTYFLHFVAGYRFKVHEIRIQFDTDTAPVTGAAAQGSFIYKGSLPVSGTLPSMFSGTQIWATSPMANITASTSWYCLHTIRQHGAATGETTNFPQSAATVRTLRDDKPLPDLWVSGEGGLCLMFRTAVAAGGNIDTIAWDVTLEIQRP